MSTQKRCDTVFVKHWWNARVVSLENRNYSDILVNGDLVSKEPLKAIQHSNT